MTVVDTILVTGSGRRSVGFLWKSAIVGQNQYRAEAWFKRQDNSENRNLLASFTKKGFNIIID